MSCPCPNPTTCSPTFCRFNDAELPVTMFDTPEPQTVQVPADLLRATNERIRRMEAGRAHLLTLKTPLHIRCLDWLGNLPYRLRKFAKAQDFDSPTEMFVVAALLVVACSMTAPFVVGWVMP